MKLVQIIFASVSVQSLLVASAFAESAPALPAGSAAAAPGVAPGAAPQPGILGMIVPFALMFGILYFLMIRPQQKKMKEHQKLLASVKTGDEVVTSSGILGTVAGVAEKVVTLEVAKNVQIKVMKSQVAQVVKGQIQDLPAQN